MQMTPDYHNAKIMRGPDLLKISIFLVSNHNEMQALHNSKKFSNLAYKLSIPVYSNECDRCQSHNVRKEPDKKRFPLSNTR